ncbi:MAG: cytidylate kinase-like family protein [Deltaproteobacteria bacterium]|jgi:cytidylate kinase
MSVITISRGSYSRGKEVAEKVAAALGYECISREILLEASEQFNIPEIKLVRAIHDAPSILERFTYGKERYVAYLKSALLKHIQKDNVVYHGMAGHFFLQDIPHVLKVRIIADLEDRIAEEMKRENLSEAEARHILKKDDDERRRWSLQLFGIDTWDPMLYDLVIHIKSITVDDAVDMIRCAVRVPHFQTTPPSQKMLDDQTMAARIQAALVDEFPTARVSIQAGEIFVDIKGSLTEKQETIDRVRRIAGHVAGIEVKMQVNIHP